MTPKEQLIQALKRLCDREDGGFRTVADTIGADDQTLYQIISGVKLPSGQPRGVGPTLQRKLSEHYPDWASRVEEPAASYGVTKSPKWPFRHLKPTDLAGLSDSDLGYIEGQLMAALRDIGAAPSTKGRGRRAM